MAMAPCLKIIVRAGYKIVITQADIHFITDPLLYQISPLTSIEDSSFSENDL